MREPKPGIQDTFLIGRASVAADPGVTRKQAAAILQGLEAVTSALLLLVDRTVRPDRDTQETVNALYLALAALKAAK